MLPSSSLLLTLASMEVYEHGLTWTTAFAIVPCASLIYNTSCYRCRLFCVVLVCFLLGWDSSYMLCIASEYTVSSFFDTYLYLYLTHVTLLHASHRRIEI